MESERIPASVRLAAMAAIIAAVGCPGSAHADPPSDNSITDELTKLGQSLCPKLVKPGASLATAVSELQGNSGLTPELTGMVAGLAIQLQCPALMASIANGDLPKLLHEATAKEQPALPFPVPGGAH